MEKELYDLSGYYDIAFSYDHSGEIPFFTRCFQTSADGEVKLSFFDAFKRLSREGGFVHKAIYNQSYEGVIPWIHVSVRAGRSQLHSEEGMKDQ